MTIPSSAQVVIEPAWVIQEWTEICTTKERISTKDTRHSVASIVELPKRSTSARVAPRTICRLLWRSTALAGIMTSAFCPIEYLSELTENIDVPKQTVVISCWWVKDGYYTAQVSKLTKSSSRLGLKLLCYSRWKWSYLMPRVTLGRFSKPLSYCIPLNCIVGPSSSGGPPNSIADPSSTNGLWGEPTQKHICFIIPVFVIIPVLVKVSHHVTKLSVGKKG